MPDAAGAATPAILSTFSSYAINDSGEYIVKATLRPGVGGVTNLNNEALLTNTGGTLRLLGREGDLTPEGGDTFSSFPTFFIGNSGATCFSSNLIGNKSSIYSTVSGGASTLIAKEGAAAAGTDSTYLNLLNPAMNHSGQILYTSTLVITGMTNPTNNAGLWRTSAPATPPMPPAPAIPPVLQGA